MSVIFVSLSSLHRKNYVEKSGQTSEHKQNQTLYERIQLAHAAVLLTSSLCRNRNELILFSADPCINVSGLLHILSLGLAYRAFVDLYFRSTEHTRQMGFSNVRPQNLPHRICDLLITQIYMQIQLTIQSGIHYTTRW